MVSSPSPTWAPFLVCPKQMLLTSSRSPGCVCCPPPPQLREPPTSFLPDRWPVSSLQIPFQTLLPRDTLPNSQSSDLSAAFPWSLSVRPWMKRIHGKEHHLMTCLLESRDGIKCKQTRCSLPRLLSCVYTAVVEGFRVISSIYPGQTSLVPGRPTFQKFMFMH